MLKYYEVLVKQTSKAINNKPDNDYRIFNTETLKFSTITEVKDYLKDTYKQVKREKMYIDGKDGQPKHIGWIYCFKNKDWSHNSEWWWQQDWVEVKEIKAKTILIN